MRHISFALMLAGAAASAAPVPADTFAVDQEPGFKPVPPALESYLDAQVGGQPGREGVQHFCVVGYQVQRSQTAEALKIAWVYWHEGQRLVYWEPAGADVDSKETLVRSRRDLNLRKDVVATHRELGSSTYCIDQPGSTACWPTAGGVVRASRSGAHRDRARLGAGQAHTGVALTVRWRASGPMGDSAKGEGGSCSSSLCGTSSSTSWRRGRRAGHRQEAQPGHAMQRSSISVPSCSRCAEWT